MEKSFTQQCMRLRHVWLRPVRRAGVGRTGVGDAFGNALGGSLASAASGVQPQGVGPYSAGDYRNGMDLQSDNAYRNRQIQPYYDQMVGAFGDVGPYGMNRSNDVLLADASGRSPNRRAPGGVNFSGDTLPSMYPDGRVIRNGHTADGRAFEEWDTGGTAFSVPMPSNLMGQSLESLAVQGTGLRYDSIKADQGLWDSLGGIANSDLSFREKLSMGWGTTKYYFRNSDEAQGTVQMIGGGFELVGAASLSSTGLGAVVGVPLAFHGGDSIGTGFSRIMGSGDGSTVTYKGIYSLTGSSTLAGTVDQAIPFAGGVGFVASGMRSAWTIRTADIAAGMRYEASQAATNTTPFLRSIADANGGEMLGLQYSLKAPDSLARKIAADPTRPINDALRYTMSFDEANFTGGVRNALSGLKAQGYEQTAFRNTFKPGQPYMGINSTYLTPGGDMFELQFHTSASFQMKDVVNHPLYELQRVLPRTDSTWNSLRQQMIQNSSTVPIPPNASMIKGVR